MSKDVSYSLVSGPHAAAIACTASCFLMFFSSVIICFLFRDNYAFWSFIKDRGANGHLNTCILALCLNRCIFQFTKLVFFVDTKNFFFLFVCDNCKNVMTRGK